MATWDSDIFGRPPTMLPNSEHPSAHLRPVKIHHFIKATVEHVTKSTLVLAQVSWYCPHPNRDIIGKPAEVWCPNLYETFGIHSFLPLKYVGSRCAYTHKVNNHDDDEVVLIVVPLLEK